LTLVHLFYKMKIMKPFEMIWRELSKRLHRKREFALDLETYESLQLMAGREQSTPEKVASRLFEFAIREQNLQTEAMRCWEDLTPRQKQIVAHICQRDTTRQIASQLHITPNTVKSHVDAIKEKFGVNSRAELRLMLSPWDLHAFL
jgi:DNA-binding CsgD family transcriptional regulator